MAFSHPGNNNMVLNLQAHQHQAALRRSSTSTDPSRTLHNRNPNNRLILTQRMGRKVHHLQTKALAFLNRWLWETVPVDKMVPKLP